MKDRQGIPVYCTVCDQRKSPVGRSVPLGMYLCDDDCEGYRLDPKPGSLWPGELKSEFGFSVSDQGTEEVP